MIVKNVGQILSIHMKSVSFMRQLSSGIKSAENTKEKWDLYSGVLLERLPILTKPLNDVETRVYVLVSN